MFLIHVLLPVHDNNKRRFDRDQFAAIRNELTKKFGGVTPFVRSPAVGLWKDEADQVSAGEVVMFEVMSPELDQEWRASYRRRLAQLFRQDELLIWAAKVTKL